LIYCARASRCFADSRLRLKIDSIKGSWIELVLLVGRTLPDDTRAGQQDWNICHRMMLIAAIEALDSGISSSIVIVMRLLSVYFARNHPGMV
jgi:hypothetical protein